MASVVDQVAQAVQASQRITATNEERVIAVQLYQQLQAGEIHASASVAAELTSESLPAEVQVVGFALLQHLVSHRWSEFSPPERQELATLSLRLLTRGAALPWALRSKAAVLLALVVTRSGAEAYEALLPRLLGLAADGSAAQEVAALTLRYLAEEVTHYSEELAGDHKRALVSSLAGALPAVLGFLRRVIENSVALLETPDASAAARAALQAAVGAASAHAEWVPLPHLLDSGLLGALGFILRRPEVREEAAEALRLAAARKGPAEEDAAGLARAQAALCEALVGAAAALLGGGRRMEPEDEDFALVLADALCALGCAHAVGVLRAGAEMRDGFLACMLALAGQGSSALADRVLPFFQATLASDAALEEGADAGGFAGSSPSPSPAPGRLLPPAAVAQLLDAAAAALRSHPIRPGVSGSGEDAEPEPPAEFESFAEYKEHAAQHRSRWAALVRAAAAALPREALRRAEAGVGTAAAAAAAGSPEALGLLEPAVVFMDSVLKASWARASAAFPPSPTVLTATEKLFAALLGMRVADPLLLSYQARGLESFGRFLGRRPDAVPAALAAAFDILLAHPLDSPARAPPPPRPSAVWRDRLTARQQVASLPLSWAKAAPAALAPHLESLAARLQELWDAGALRDGERNALAEALLAAAAAGAPSLQATVLGWVLAPVRAAWAAPAWLARLASPEAFAQAYCPRLAEATPAPGPPQLVGGSSERWALYHELHLVERAVRRQAPPDVSAAAAQGEHPFAEHARWALPCVLRIAACVQALHAPGALPLELQPALELSLPERALYLKRGLPGRAGARAVVAQAAPGQPAQADDEVGDFASVGGASTGALRGWLRHMREFSYQTLGLLPSSAPRCLLDASLAPAADALAPCLLAAAEAAPAQNLRLLLRHALQPLLRHSPPAALERWVIPLLAGCAELLARRLGGDWEYGTATVAPPAALAAAPASARAAEDEVVRDAVRRELITEWSVILVHVSTKAAEAPDPGNEPSDRPGKPLPPNAQPPPLADAGKGLFAMLLRLRPSAAGEMLRGAVLGLAAADEVAFRCSVFCRHAAALAPHEPRLGGVLGREVLAGALTCLGSQALATHQVEVLGLVRDVLALAWGGGAGGGVPEALRAGWAAAAPAAAQGAAEVLGSLPKAREPDLRELQTAFAARNSEKAQRDLLRRFLLRAADADSFAGLQTWKPAGAVVGVVRARGGGGGAGADDDGLQGDAFRAIFG